MNKKKIITIVVFIIIIAGLGAYFFQPGTYVNARNYQLKDVASYEELRDKVELLKTNDSQYKAYSEDSVEFKPEIDNLGYLTMFVHLPRGKANVFFKTDTKRGLSGQVELKLIGVSRDSIDRSWKWFNTNELSKEDNKKYIKCFESEILDKLGKWKSK
ncbi:hypothetical protein [uncultured Dysgonomonas sp.]|uniref:Uncharacterized protein n=1 Tax=uncultured Dysgonomonas sp. TaxID=206096 RepID=A0A212ITS7_9BACT|nr:hypothetical protein [uncultured Dysgonomonas sp.]SBV90592.1 exported hypothetical protein [uncultured Dysgonomonas sp.]